MEQPYILPILYYQYHSCWCLSDVGINRHGIEQISQNILSLASEKLMFKLLLKSYCSVEGY